MFYLFKSVLWFRIYKQQFVDNKLIHAVNVNSMIETKPKAKMTTTKATTKKATFQRFCAAIELNSSQNPFISRVL